MESAACSMQNCQAPLQISWRPISMSSELQTIRDNFGIIPGAPSSRASSCGLRMFSSPTSYTAQDFERLKGEFRRSKTTTVLNIDAWHAVKSLLPPKERRGLVLIDPPFESREEFDNLATAVAEATRRFATGTYLIWYPLKHEVAADRFVAAVTAQSELEFLDVRLSVCAAFAGLGLTAAGVLVLNPPYVLREELEAIMPRA